MKKKIYVKSINNYKFYKESQQLHCSFYLLTFTTGGF
jgi:hypothetical protein